MATLAKQPTKKQKAINYFVDELKAVKEDYHGSIFLTYQKNNFPVLAIFEGSGFRPNTHFRFKNDAELTAYANQQKEYIKKRFDAEQIRMQGYTKEKEAFQTGKILYSSWGFEQTNIDFYVILERKNDFVTIQEIGQTREIDSRYGDRGTVTPDLNNKIGEPFKKKISKYASVNIASYKYCSVWDGQPKYYSSYA